MKFNRSNNLKARFHEVIPGGSHSYAKGDDQFPEFSAPYIVKGKGCHVWDIDGNEFIEYGSGSRSVTLGHAYPSVLEAAQRQMQLGCNFGRPAPIELECAEDLLALIEGAEMVKFAKNGSDVNNVAIKLSRAYTGRDMVAVCADHPLFSHDDWFIGSTPMDAGIPRSVKELTVKFRYNNLESVENLFKEHPGQIACVILEPEKQDSPGPDYLKKLKELCHKNGVVFILDEMITGFRWHLNGAQKLYDVVPDLSTFGKGMSNGYSLSALAGKKEIMELGGLLHNKERVYFSSTHGAEYHCLAAARETMRIYRSEPVIDHLYKQGEKLREGITRSVQELKLEDYFGMPGRSCCLVFYTKDNEKKPSQPFRTLFLQETIKRGLIMPSLSVSYSHSDKDIQETVEKVHEALIVYKNALEEGIEKYLEGRPVQPVFRKYN